MLATDAGTVAVLRYSRCACVVKFQEINQKRSILFIFKYPLKENVFSSLKINQKKPTHFCIKFNPTSLIKPRMVSRCSTEPQGLTQNRQRSRENSPF